MTDPVNTWKFLEQQLVLWERPETNEKMQGIKTWPFDIAIPKDITIENGDGTTSTYVLPQTFFERNVAASIQYDLAVHIKRGGFMQASSKW